jgi:3'-phosphoadenosine 5'-phosphosulfate (PAPS) 3'-phosphatase
MAEGKSDFYANLVPGFKHWDMCGSEAILQSRFGIVTDASMQPLSYSPDAPSHTIQGGILAAKSTMYLKVCANRI